MISILVVEDQPDKANDICKFIEGYFGDDVEIFTEGSLRSGMIKIVSHSEINLIILDMSMPKFTDDPDDPGISEPVSFAGEEIMQQMMIREINIPTIVLTQYSIFEKGSVTLEELDVRFRSEFQEFYIGSVYYSSSVPEWRKNIKKLLDNKIYEINSNR